MIRSDDELPAILYVSVIAFPAGATFGPYRLDRVWVLNWMIDGTAVAYPEGVPTPLMPHSLLLLPPGTSNRFDWDARHATRHGSVYLRIPRPDPTWRRSLTLDPDDVMLSLLTHVVWLYADRPPGWDTATRHALAAMLDAYGLGSRSEAAVSESQAPPKVFDRAATYIRTAWRNGITPVALRELAAAAGVSPTHLCRVFDRHVGTGPIEALRLIRVARAAGLLTRTTLTLEEVARRTGFRSRFHFSRVFAAVTGTPPSMFQRDGSAHFALPDALRRLDASLAEDHP